MRIADSALQHRRRFSRFRSFAASTGSRDRGRERSRRGRLRPGGQPHLELRPVAARAFRCGRNGSSASWGRSSSSTRARADPARRRRVPGAARARATWRRSRRRWRSRARAASSRCSRRGRGRRRACARSSRHRPRSGSARIAIDAGVPLVPAAIKGSDKLSRLRKLKVAYGEPIALRRPPRAAAARRRTRPRPSG